MKPKTIVVVEDNELNLELMTDLLELHDYKVIGIASAEEALKQIALLQPDLVLMDIALPGMDGLFAAERLKTNFRTAHIPIVIVSAHAMKEDQDSAQAVGCAGFMTKPIDTRTFVQTIEQIMFDFKVDRTGT